MLNEVLFLSGLTFLVAWTVITWLALGIAMLLAGFPRLKLRQVAGVVAVVAWVCALVASPMEGWLLLSATAVVVLLAFAAMWVHEFRALMLRRDDEFPGRHDKLVWAVALLLIAPAGVWLFRAYRKAQWPDPPRPRPARSETAPDPAGAPPAG
jgi:hypothetical protein